MDNRRFGTLADALAYAKRCGYVTMTVRDRLHARPTQHPHGLTQATHRLVIRGGGTWFEWNEGVA